MRVRVSAQMGVMTETPDSPLLRKPQCVWAAANDIRLVLSVPFGINYSVVIYKKVRVALLVSSARDCR
jgi:hypothetical protein